MKVIGKTEKNYICEVSHTEIEKFLNQYYSDPRLSRLKIGEIVNLGKGYDWCRDTESALRETKTFIEKNKKIVKIIMEGFSILGELSEKEQE